MDKNAFLGELALILRQRGLSDEDIRVRIEKVSSLIDGLSEDERNAVIGGNPNVAALADRLFLRDSGAGGTPRGGAKDKERDPGKNRPPITDKGANDPVHKKKKVAGEGDSSRTPPSKADDFKITSDYKKSGQGQDQGSAGKNVAEIRRRDEEKLRALKNEAQKPKKKTTPASLAERYENERNFWVIVFCCIPILFFFALLLLMVFGAIFLGLVALIVVLVFALGAAVAVGSGVSLIGVGYGFFQFVSVGGINGVGLYELGLGLVIAGITMLAGVLIYNAAIRMIPWIMKKLRVLFKFVLKKIGVLAEYLKGVCASI